MHIFPEKPKPIRLCGNRVHITPLERKGALKSAGGIHLVESPENLDEKQFLVLGIGPGKWEYHPVPGKRQKRRVWVSPEVVTGDRVLVDINNSNGIAIPDGTWIIDARYILLKW